MNQEKLRRRTPAPRGRREEEEAEWRLKPESSRPGPFPSFGGPPRRPCWRGGANGSGGIAGSRGARSMRGARSGPGAERRPAGAHPAQWVLIAPGNPAGPLRGRAALPQRRARPPAPPAGSGSRRALGPGDRGGCRGCCGRPAPPGGAKAALRHGRYTRPRTVPALPSPGTPFPSLISAFNLRVSLGFCQGLLPPMPLMGSRCPLPALPPSPQSLPAFLEGNCALSHSCQTDFIPKPELDLLSSLFWSSGAPHGSSAGAISTVMWRLTLSRAAPNHQWEDALAPLHVFLPDTGLSKQITNCFAVKEDEWNRMCSNAKTFRGRRHIFF